MCRISDYSQYSAEALKFPWWVEDSDINRDWYWARNCSVVIKGLPDEAKSADFMPAMMTLNGNLPHYNHEVIATSFPFDSNGGPGHRGVAWIRWSHPQFAEECVKMFHRHRVLNRWINCAISDYPVKVNAAMRNYKRVIGGVMPFADAWLVMEEIEV